MFRYFSTHVHSLSSSCYFDVLLVCTVHFRCCVVLTLYCFGVSFFVACCLDAVLFLLRALLTRSYSLLRCFVVCCSIAFSRMKPLLVLDTGARECYTSDTNDARRLGFAHHCHCHCLVCTSYLSPSTTVYFETFLMGLLHQLLLAMHHSAIRA